MSASPVVTNPYVCADCRKFSEPEPLFARVARAAYQNGHLSSAESTGNSCFRCHESLTDRELVHFVQLPKNDAWIRHQELIKAVDHNDLPAIQRLFAVGNVSERARMNAFELAAANGNIEVFDWILDVTPISNIFHFRQYRVNAFRLAGEAGHLEILKRLLDTGDVSQDALNRVFHVSIQNNRSDIVDLLTERTFLTEDTLIEGCRFADELGFSQISTKLRAYITV